MTDTDTPTERPPEDDASDGPEQDQNQTPSQRQETTAAINDGVQAAVSDGGEYLDPSQGDVERNADGEIIPQETQAGHLGKALVKPMPYGTVQEYFGSGRHSNLGPSDLATLFSEHIIKPDLDAHYDGLDGEVISEVMQPLTPRAYLTAIMDVSDIDAEKVQMYDDGSADVTVAQGN